MPMLDTNKLNGKIGGFWAKGIPTKVTAKGEEYRCPACAMDGGDEGGQHLIVFKDRATFACAAYPGDRAHRAIIWEEAGIENGGRPDPVIPRKVDQKNTFIGKHVMDMEMVAEEVRARDADLVAARRKAEEDAEKAKRLAKANITQTQHIDTNSNKVQVGTFGTVILSSSNMPPPPYKENTTVGMGGGYAPPICKKASQTSQVRIGCRARDGGVVASHEFDSTDLGVVFDTRRSDWREQYYAVWAEKYKME